ncbi:MAG: hypothetical protein BVN33_12590 [Proteobacteria bacterium ST_bin13]|nr:MAG: hypothetical protein BVN33_12590 [Proteobacteria bacterium ST_bin13]
MAIMRFMALLIGLAVSVAAAAEESPHDFGGAIPLSPEGWFSQDDYPPQAKANRKIGLVRFQFDINMTGRVEHCTITLSSGSPDLDQQTCRLLARRGRFKPPVNEQGEPIATKGRSQVLWRL